MAPATFGLLFGFFESSRSENFIASMIFCFPRIATLVRRPPSYTCGNACRGDLGVSQPFNRPILARGSDYHVDRVCRWSGQDLRLGDTLDMDIALCLLCGKLVETKSSEIKRRRITW